MKISPGSIAIFLAGCGVTFLAWDLVWKKTPPDSAPATPVTATKGKLEENSWPKEKSGALIKQVTDAKDDESRFRSCLDLAEIPPQDIVTALESMLSYNQPASHPAFQTLLIRWAAIDGDAALKWAWKTFKDARGWNEAAHQISASWAWNDPRGFQRWCLESPHVGYDQRETAAALAKSSEVPVLDMFFISRAVNSLIDESPYLTYDLIVKRGGGFYGLYPRYAHALETPEEVREALSAFPDLGNLKTGDQGDTQLAALALLERWRELDPVNFAASPHAKVLPPLPGTQRSFEEIAAEDPGQALEQTDSLPVVDRAASLARAFKAWQDTHLDEAPDMRGWSSERMEAWEDMEALR
jgi:hypothetical protein